MKNVKDDKIEAIQNTRDEIIIEQIDNKNSSSKNLQS